MTKAEIRQTVADFGIAAKNALEAGFDGVQIQANYLYLIAQFLNSGTNLRTDEYGGSIENRASLPFEIAETVLKYVEPGQVGIKIGPMHLTGPFVANADTLPGMEYGRKRNLPLRLDRSEPLGWDARAIQAGAKGYLLKDVPREALMDSIRRVHAGETFVPLHLVAKLADRVSGETQSEREIEVLKLMAQGKTKKEIATAFFYHRRDGEVER